MSTDTHNARVLARYPEAVCVDDGYAFRPTFAVYPRRLYGSPLATAKSEAVAWELAASRLPE